MHRLPLVGSLTLVVLILSPVAAVANGNLGVRTNAHDFKPGLIAPVPVEPTALGPVVNTNQPWKLRIEDNFLESDVALPQDLAQNLVSTPVAYAGEIAAPQLTVAHVLSRLGFVLDPADVVYPVATEPAPRAGKIVISRAPGVTIAADGKVETVKTRAASVKDVLAEKQITLDGDDRVEPAAETKLIANLSIKVVRVEIKEEKEKETVKFATIYKDDATRYKGEEVIKTAGVNGELEKTLKITLEDGKEIKRDLAGKKTTKEAVDKVVLRGTKPKPAPKPSPPSSPKTPPASGPASGAYADLINAAAAKYGVNAQDLSGIMLCESGGYRFAQSGSYYGLFQFSKSLWSGSWNPYRNEDIFTTNQIFAAALYISLGGRGAWPNC